jgi:hypothetical protein
MGVHGGTGVPAVEVRFTAVDPLHTRVELEHRGWERLGDQGNRARAGYEDGWPRVLDAFAGAAMGAHHRWFARSLNGLVWRLLARPSRTPEDDARMVDAAHASQYHWREVGGPPETRGEWLVSHVYAVLGRPEPALHHARRCLELADGEPRVADFDHAYAAEAMARALACAGELDQAAPGTRGPPPPAPPSPTTRTVRSSPETSPPAPGSA